MQRYSYFDAYCNHTLSAEDDLKIQNLVQFIDSRVYYCGFYRSRDYVVMCDLGHIHTFLDILDHHSAMPQAFAVDEKICERYSMHNIPPHWNYDASEVKLDEFESFNPEIRSYINDFPIVSPDNHGLILPNNLIDDGMLGFLLIQSDILDEAVELISPLFNR